MQQNRELLRIVRHATIVPRRLDGNIPLRLEDPDGGLRRDRAHARGRQPLSKIKEGRVEIVVVVLLLVVREARMEVARQRSVRPRPTPWDLSDVLPHPTRGRGRGRWGAWKRGRWRRAERGPRSRGDRGHGKPLANRVDEGEEDDHTVCPGYEAPDAGLKHRHAGRGKATVDNILVQQSRRDTSRTEPAFRSPQGTTDPVHRGLELVAGGVVGENGAVLRQEIIQRIKNTDESLTVACRDSCGEERGSKEDAKPAVHNER